MAYDGQTYTLAFQASGTLGHERFNALAATTHAQWNNNFGLGLKWYYVRTTSSAGGSSFYDKDIDNDGVDDGHSDQRINIAPNTQFKKFLIDHEMGHAVHHDFMGLAKYSVRNCGYGGSSYTDISKEYQSCAFNEGFAHFYASAAWNDVTESDCYMDSIGVGLVDCEIKRTPPQAEVDWAVRYMETQLSAPFGGYGVKLDWWRMFWDVRTDYYGLDFEEMADWMSSADTWTDTTVYDELEAEASQIGNPFYGSSWTAASDTSNGINY